MFARILDKIRLNAAGNLPADYTVGTIEGKRTFDDRLCKFLNVEFEVLEARVLQGDSDETILEWCFEHGRNPDPEQIEIWNGFMSKRGWRDPQSALDQAKIEAGFGDRPEIQTFFDLMDLEEGHPA